jgi:hypothetical protein
MSFCSGIIRDEQTAEVRCWPFAVIGIGEKTVRFHPEVGHSNHLLNFLKAVGLLTQAK